MRLDNFIQTQKINEKVSKKDAVDALKNKDVLLGAEFELVSDKLAEILNKIGGDGDDSYESAFDMYEDYEERLTEYEKLLSDIEASIKTKQSHLKTARKGRDIRSERLVDVLVDDIQELLSRKMILITPELPEEYIEYFEDFVDEYGDEDFYDIESWKPGDRIPEPPDLREMFNDMEDWEWAIKKLPLKDLPFKNYKIGDYGSKKNIQKPGDKNWVIEPDGSLGRQGMEIKSPPLPLKEFLKVVPKMFKWIQQNGGTDDSTGFHIHISIKGVKNLKGKLDPVKLALMFDENYIWGLFPDRMDNDYVKSVKDKLKKKGDITPKELDRVIDKKKAKTKIFSNHDDAINLESWKEGHIEYRYLGGKDYHRKWDDIKYIIGMYVDTFLTAVDEDYKKREYIQRLNRIFNKMELYKNRKKLERLTIILDILIKDYIDEKPLIKDVKLYHRKLEQETSVLRAVYKLDSKTISMIQKNKSYVKGVDADIKADLWELVRGKSHNAHLYNDIKSFASPGKKKKRSK